MAARSFASSDGVIVHEVTRVGPEHTRVTRCRVLISANSIPAIAYLESGVQMVRVKPPGEKQRIAEPCKICSQQHDKGRWYGK